MNIAVLGSGLVGKPMAIDLAIDNRFNITCFDNDSSKFDGLDEFAINYCECDLLKSDNIKSLLKDFDLVINAVPGFMGFETLKSLIENKKNVVDIAFYDHDPFDLNEFAIKNGVTAMVDAGVSPGLSNLLIGEGINQFDELKSLKIFVGGLPKVRDGLYNYKAVFSPTDVLEEYIRPARLVEDGKVVIRPALSEVEEIEFEKIGVLEAFNSDGLRTILKTIDCPNMVEKTLRYPGHVERIEFLRDSGFLNKNEFEHSGAKVSPFYFSAQVLSKLWELKSDDKDVTILRVELSGKSSNSDLVLQFNVYDEFNDKTKTHSMARTTGYVATMCARLLADGLFNEKGIFPLELLGKDKKSIEYIKTGLEKRGISINEKKILK
jgi:lysine 6-dehydrogenase